jgi:MFS family permease
VLAVLRRRDFALLWFGGLISIAGDWVLYAALPFFVYERTGSTVATAGMIVASLTPAVLLGSFAGVFVDRWDRKRVLVASNLLQAAIVVLLLLVPGDGWLWVVYVVAVAQSCIAAFASPAESALLPSLVGEADLVAANALNALNNRIARLVGAPAGGALLAAAGLQPVVLVDCLSFVLAALLIAPIAAPRATRSEQPGDVEAIVVQSRLASFWTEWLAGLRLVGGERTIAVLFLVFGLMTFGGTMLDPLSAAWVRDVLHEGPEVFSLLLTAHAATAIVAALLVGRFGVRAKPRDLIGWASLIAAAGLFVKYNVPVVAVAFVTTAIAGMTSVASSIGVETLAQRAVPDEYRGRVFGSLQATMFLLSLLGAVTSGVLAEVVGVVPVLNVAAALILVAGLVVLRAFAEPARVVAGRVPRAQTAEE